MSQVRHRAFYLSVLLLGLLSAGSAQQVSFRITPLRPVAELRAEALEAQPPHEQGTFRKPDLVELVTLDPTIKLDIRYATSNDFLGTPVYTQARAFLQRREFAQAMATCKAVGAVPGGTSAGHACAAEAQLLHKRASEALIETGLALADGSRGYGAYEAKVAEGLAHELEVKDAEAEASFRQAIAWRPDAPEAHAWLGRLLVRTLKHADGVAELRRSVALDPTNPEVDYELALTLPAGTEAEGLLRTAVRERPSYVLALLQLASVQLERGELAEAQASADACLRYDPRETAGQIVGGNVALAEGRADDAVHFGQAALALLPNSARARLLIADAYAKKGEVDLAIESYQAAYGLDPTDPAPLVRASEACHREGRDTSARAFGERATKDFADWGPGWVALGDALAGQKEVAAARAAYESALKASGPVDAGAVRKKLAALK